MDRRGALIAALKHRLDQFEARTNGNEEAIRLLGAARIAVEKFSACFQRNHDLRRQVSRTLSKITRRDNIVVLGGWLGSPMPRMPLTGVLRSPLW